MRKRSAISVGLELAAIQRGLEGVREFVTQCLLGRDVLQDDVERLRALLSLLAARLQLLEDCVTGKRDPAIIAADHNMFAEEDKSDDVWLHPWQRKDGRGT